MTWTPRQVALLAEMGLTVWAAPPDDAAVVAAVTDAEAVTRSRVRSTGTASPTPTPTPTPTATSTFTATSTVTDASTATDVDAPPPPRDPTPPRVDGPVPAWTALRGRVSVCTACALCAGRTHGVFDAGDRPAGWLLVGEPPGDDEDATGLPYAGKSGRLLDNMLFALRLARDAGADDGTPPASRARVAHAVRCRPPLGQPVGAVEIAACRLHMAAELALTRPAVVVAMGRAAVGALLDTDEPLGRLRGRVHMAHGRPVVVTYDPAYLLRHPQDKAGAWSDLCLAAATAESGVHGG